MSELTFEGRDTHVYYGACPWLQGWLLGSLPLLRFTFGDTAALHILLTRLYAPAQGPESVDLHMVVYADLAPASLIPLGRAFFAEYWEPLVRDIPTMQIHFYVRPLAERPMVLPHPAAPALAARAS